MDHADPQCHDCDRIHLALQRANDRIQDLYRLLESRDAQLVELELRMKEREENGKRHIAAEAQVFYLEQQLEELCIENESLRAEVGMVKERKPMAIKPQAAPSSIEKTPSPIETKPLIDKDRRRSSLLAFNAHIAAQLSALYTLVSSRAIADDTLNAVLRQLEEMAVQQVALQKEVRHLPAAVARDVSSSMTKYFVTRERAEQTIGNENTSRLQRIEDKLDRLLAPDKNDIVDHSLSAASLKDPSSIQATSFVPPPPCCSFAEYSRRWDRVAADAGASHGRFSEPC